ncbi:FMN-dependent oxidoreductase, nitrilotriacetate monooxygenase family [Cnuella takakiae]|uniref:FMN-dependent oxidoreductase, nitrilotriacetate monooxygenase family n=1 Tax=Cnuella takakiae TaxID=1302690 RepID=A0A1M5EE65_9BACT|nr:LLM class flavin-dependent oxidoreductase [Cnuella takakiae]OLY91150.1 monooxygenase [Cnuella takakiae]SHF77486.1 FMN-dependent oxidoreductase, nitrilotriacetate monooxygenase family [Cnuella takakiae]
MSDRKKLKLAAIIEGPGWNFVGWQHPDIPADSSENINFYIQQAKLAEAAKFDTLFLIDVSHVGPGNIPHYLSMFEGVTIMSALSMVTKTIGLSATVSTSYADPYSVARQILSLDKISKGRASLNAITSNPGGMVNFSRGHLGKQDQNPMQKEFSEILLGLWDTYEDDAFIRDKESGVYLNPYKMHTVDYRGEYFSVDGPLNISRSVQGRPVLYTAGTSPTLFDHATRYTDGVFTHGSTLQEAVLIANEIRRRLIEKNRRPEDFIVSISQNPIVGKTEQEAQEKYLALLRYIPKNSIPRPQFYGSAEKVADQVQQWHEHGAMDMLILRQDHPYGIKDLIELVVPILQERGIFRTEYESDTLRGNLELPRPAFRKI